MFSGSGDSCLSVDGTLLLFNTRVPITSKTGSLSPAFSPFPQLPTPQRVVAAVVAGLRDRSDEALPGVVVWRLERYWLAAQGRSTFYDSTEIKAAGKHQENQSGKKETCRGTVRPGCIWSHRLSVKKRGKGRIHQETLSLRPAAYLALLVICTDSSCSAQPADGFAIDAVRCDERIK